MSYRLPMFKTTVVICLFNCLIAFEAKCCPSNDSNFTVCFMIYTLNIIYMLTRLTGPIKRVDSIYSLAV